MNDDFDALLHDAMSSRTRDLTLPDGLARRAIIRARRTRRVQQVAGVTAVAAMAGAGVGGFVNLRASGGSRGVAAGSGPGSGPGSIGAASAGPTSGTTGCGAASAEASASAPIAPSSAAALASARAAASAPAAMASASAMMNASPSTRQPSAALLAVTLPNPAPGFPLRREPDSSLFTVMGDGAYWTRTFLVGWATDSANPCGTGPGATAIVADGEPAPYVHNGVLSDADPGAKLQGTATIQGRTAYITVIDQDKPSEAETILVFSSGRFTVTIAGWNTTVDQLVDLGNALQGLQ